MAAPCASGAIWKTFIQQPALVFLETLLSQVQEARESDSPAFEIPTIKVYKDCFHSGQRDQATAMLGIDFATVSDSPSSSSSSLLSSPSSQSAFLVMTVLQYSILSLFAGQPEDADQRELIIEMLVKSLSPEEINGQLFENDNNALHLAAFLNMESTLHLLIAYGGNPLIQNGHGLSAFDILFEVTPAGFVPPTSPRSHRASYPSCSFMEKMAPATTILARAASVASAMRALPSEGSHSTFQPFSSTAAVHLTHEDVQHNTKENEDEVEYNKVAPVRITAECEVVGENDSLELDLEDGLQVFQQTNLGDEDSFADHLPSRDALGRTLACDNKAFEDGYDHDDLDGYSGSNNAHHVERDAQDMDPYYFQRNKLELQFLQEQLELDDFESQKTQLHEDPTCFFRIRPDGPGLVANGTRLVSILKNRQAWRPEQLSIEHAQSFKAYEAYIERLRLQRKPDVPHVDDSRHQPVHEKSVQWDNIKQVREYQRHMNCQLDMDGWDGLLVSEPYDEPVDDSFVPIASPYDIVRPVTPVRPRSHALSMSFNNSSLDLSSAGDVDRISSPLPRGSARPLPEIPQSAKSSFFGYRKGTPPPPSFLSKAKTTLVATASHIPSQGDEQAKSPSSQPFSKRLSAPSLLWNPKRPGSPFAKMSFSSSDSQLRSPTMASSLDSVCLESAVVLGQRDSTEVAPLLVTESSQWVPRVLRNLTSPPNSHSKARSRGSLDSSQSIPRTQTVQEMLFQAAPFSISSDMSLHGERPTIVDYDTIFPGSVPFSSLTTTATATPKMFAQLKSALKEKFGSPSFPPRAVSSTPHRVSTPPILPSIPMTQSLSESSSSNMRTSLFSHGLLEFPAHESSLDRCNVNSNVNKDAGAASDDAHKGDKALTSLHQRRPSALAITCDQLDAIRAHTPRVTPPLAAVSYSRSTTRSLQLCPLRAQDSRSDLEDAKAETFEDGQDDLLTAEPRAINSSRELSQSAFQTADHRLSLTGVANHFLSNVDAATLTFDILTAEIQEDPNRPALPERTPSRAGSSSSSLLLPWSQQTQTKNSQGTTTAVPFHHRKPSETSVTKHANWKKRKEVVVVRPLRKSSLPSGSVSDLVLPLEQIQDLASTVEELGMEEIPICGVDDGAETDVAEVLDAIILSDTESLLANPASPVATNSALQSNDSRTKHYQNMLVKSTKLAAKTKLQYVLPELVFSAAGPEEMEYLHGVTHTTSSVLITDTQGDSNSSLMGAVLVNIQGIGHGLEVQKYNLRQSTVVERFSDVDHSSMALPLQDTSLQPVYRERYASLWMDVGEFESRPRRSTLSNCGSPSTTQTGVLYLRFKKICDFSLPLSGEDTMVSIRIDTGYEKVDTDYVPLEDIDMIINQEFCLPVCPGLVITITLHLMQAPHLQPRYHQQHLLPITAYSLPARAIVTSNNTTYTLNQHPMDRPTSAPPYMQKSLPALPLQSHHHQQQEPRTSTTGSEFNSVEKRSLLSSLFNKRSQPSSPSSSIFGTANFGIFNNNALPLSRPGTPGWRRPSSSQVLLSEDSPLHSTGGRTVSLFGHRSKNHAALAAVNSVSLPWVNNNSSSSTTVDRPSTPLPPPTSSLIPPPTRAASTPPLTRFLQHSGSTSSTASTSASTSASESSLSTPPSSCGSPDDSAEGEKKSGSTFAKWKKGLLNVRKKNRSQLKQQQESQPSPVAGHGSSLRSAMPTLLSPAAITDATQQQLSVDQEQWPSYWKELGEQHRRSSTGTTTTARSFSPQASSFSNVAANHTATGGTAPFSTASSLPFSSRGLSDIKNNNIVDINNGHNDNTNSINSANIKDINTTNAPVPYFPQLTQAQIRATESPHEILSRHILFDDELCIARTGIVFEEIRAACTNQFVNIEFQTINNWIDLNDYSRVQEQLGRNSASPSVVGVDKDSGRCLTPAAAINESGDDTDNDLNNDTGDEEREERSFGRDAMVANIQTTVCFIPGPEMDSEDAIYEDAIAPSEPQSLVDCHVGLKYFHWQNRISFHEALFYSTGNQQQQRWREGRFCIVGSFLWQCRPLTPRDASRRHHSHEQQQHEEEEERWRCLDLSLVHGIETSLGYFNARARFLETADIDSNANERQHQQKISTSRVRDVSEDYYPVRNGFRLCMAQENSTEGQRTMFDMEFYAETAELGQRWVSALMVACRERPPVPYWMAPTTA
ncbi:hypothetical protein BGZ47_000449 [Haplosporangium gracile]|nr:hypothetical protein BGZ47_000449 [Haplosporangium gracile]